MDEAEASVKAAEMPEGTRGNLRKLLRGFGIMAPLTVSSLREILSEAGLAVVSQADKLVLEACAALTDEDLKYWAPRPASCRERSMLAIAELARRKTPEEDE